jgi:hypothetical protein
MERIEGESLASRQKRRERLTEGEVMRLLRDAAEALAYLHGQGVVHRDLKPGNILQRSDGSFAFVDFGAVRDRMKPEGGSTVVGTFGYMAPEQFQGRALPSSDVYAVAATCVAMLTGMQPEELPHRGLAIDVRAALRGRASEGLVSALAKMLEPDPERRAARVEIPREARSSRSPSWDASRDREPWDRYAVRLARKEARRARRNARRARRATGRDRKSWPIPFLFVVLVGLAIARVAVSVVMLAVVPLALGLLSLVFGRGLRHAARRVSGAGERAYDALNRAAAGGPLEPSEAKVRVESAGDVRDARARVSDGESEDEAWDEAGEPTEEAERRDRR